MSNAYGIATACVASDPCDLDGLEGQNLFDLGRLREHKLNSDEISFVHLTAPCTDRAEGSCRSMYSCSEKMEKQCRYLFCSFFYQLCFSASFFFTLISDCQVNGTKGRTAWFYRGFCVDLLFEGFSDLESWSRQHGRCSLYWLSLQIRWLSAVRHLQNIQKFSAQKTHQCRPCFGLSLNPSLFCIREKLQIMDLCNSDSVTFAISAGLKHNFDLHTLYHTNDGQTTSPPWYFYPI